MNRCLKDKLQIAKALAAVAVTGDTSGTGIDTQGCEALSFAVVTGVNAGTALSGSNKIDILMQHSDVDVDGSYANCADDDMFEAEDGANGIAKALDATGDASAVHFVHYRGKKRYVRVRFDETGTVDMPIGAIAIKGHNRANPG